MVYTNRATTNGADNVPGKRTRKRRGKGVKIWILRRDLQPAKVRIKTRKRAQNHPYRIPYETVRAIRKIKPNTSARQAFTRQLRINLTEAARAKNIPIGIRPKTARVPEPERPGPAPTGAAGRAEAPGAEARDAAPDGTRAAGRDLERSGVRYFTWFRAAGSMGEGSFKDLYREFGADSIAEEISAPTIWFSNQSALLGQVRFDGVVPLDVLFARLNSGLQFVGEETPHFDFRREYSTWSWKYQVEERVGVRTSIIVSQSEERP